MQIAHKGDCAVAVDSDSASPRDEEDEDDDDATTGDVDILKNDKFVQSTAS